MTTGEQLSARREDSRPPGRVQRGNLVIKRILAGVLLALAIGSPAYATDATPSTSASGGPSKTADHPNAPKPCEAYLYQGTRVNLCDRFPGPDVHVTCAQVGYRVKLRNSAVDPWGLDGSGGGSRGVIGVGCESKPLHPKSSPSATPTGTQPTPSVSATAAGLAGPSLPTTGPRVWALAGAGLLVLLVGAVSLLAVRRRQTRFTA